MLELLAPGFLYSASKDLWGWVRGRRRRLKPAQIVQLRLKWKVEIEKELFERTAKKLRSDIIIRDMRRIDSYPNIEKMSKGISSWFKVGLIGTYHRGIIVGLRWESIIADQKTGQLMSVDWSAKEKGDHKAILAGYIPFESIETVDWEGDEFYRNAIFYCHFDGPKSQPYEELAYCDEGDINGHKFYTKIAPYTRRRHRKERVQR